ncbi:MAG: hypothetical protein ACPGSN_07230 [Psychrobium sp.]
MQSWKKLSSWQKALVSIVVLSAVVVMPELLPLIDIGGIELIFGFIVLNYKNAVHWFTAKARHMSAIISIVKHAISASVLCRPKVYIIHAGICSLALLITGSLVISTSFLFPVILMNGILA